MINFSIDNADQNNKQPVDINRIISGDKPLHSNPPLKIIPRQDSVELSGQGQALLKISPQSSSVEEDPGSLYDSKQTMQLQLIRSLFGDEQADKFEERINKLKDITQQNQEAVETVQKTPPPQQITKLEATHISAERIEVTVKNKDGSELTLQYSRIEGEWVQITNQSDPLVLDLNNNGIELTDAAHGVEFDITGDGTKEKTAFVTGGDGFLAIDRDQNGTIDSGKELFGDQNGAANGFLELAKFDDNKDNQIDIQDRIYKSLLVFREANMDGISQKNELYKLPDLGISSISLFNRNVDLISNGNRISQLGTYYTADGKVHTAGDVWLNYLA
jgi:hypothetical protein